MSASTFASSAAMTPCCCAHRLVKASIDSAISSMFMGAPFVNGCDVEIASCHDLGPRHFLPARSVTGCVSTALSRLFFLPEQLICAVEACGAFLHRVASVRHEPKSLFFASR